MANAFKIFQAEKQRLHLGPVALGLDGIPNLPFLFGLFVESVEHDFRRGISEAKSLDILLGEWQQLFAAE